VDFCTSSKAAAMVSALGSACAASKAATILAVTSPERPKFPLRDSPVP